MSKYLILKGCAGLGNRLFTIMDAISFCEQTNRKLYVDWSDGQFGEYKVNIFYEFFNINHSLFTENLPLDFNSTSEIHPLSWIDNCDKSVYDLFQVGEPDFFLRNLPGFLLSKKNRSRKSQLWIKNGDSSFYGLKEVFNQKNMSFGSNISSGITAKYLIYSDFLPHLKNINNVKYLSLNSQLENDLQDWLLKFRLNDNFVGVHVRSTDKKPKKAVKFLINMIKEEFQNYTVFLSTDSLEIEKLFLKEFRDKIVTYPKDLFEKGNNNRGIHMWGLDNNDVQYKTQMLRFSIMDMWLLSSCKFLIYQANSSFSLFSKYLMKDNQFSYGW